MLMRWFRAFLPKEERFFDLFDRHAQTVVQGALALQDMLRGGDETPVFCQRVNQFENDADGVTREVLTAVRRTFITPFDRGDIKNLITAMDDSIDQMQQTAKAVILFEVRSFEPPMREIGQLLVECAQLVGRALPLLKSIGENVTELTLITEEIGKLEGRVDDLHDIGLKGLFLKNRSANTMDFVVGAAVIFAALVGAIVWNLITWALGIPSSSSHALIGGLVGAGMAKAGISAAVWSGLSKTLLAIVLSPLVGFLLALVLVAIVSWLSVRSTPFAVDRAFRILQFVSASLYSLGHGGNDAQKTMGIIAVLLYSQGHIGSDFNIPFWVVLACQAAMGLGTLMGGWRIVRTVGLRITKLTPMQGFCAETGGAATLFMATYLGVPVSTTHTITGAIVGVGAARRVSAVRWNVASSIIYAWVSTIPASALVAALTYWAVLLIR